MLLPWGNRISCKNSDVLIKIVNGTKKRLTIALCIRFFLITLFGWTVRIPYVFCSAKMSAFILIRKNRGRFSYHFIHGSGEVPSYFGPKLELSSTLKLFDRAHSCHQMEIWLTFLMVE